MDFIKTHNETSIIKPPKSLKNGNCEQRRPHFNLLYLLGEFSIHDHFEHRKLFDKVTLLRSSDKVVSFFASMFMWNIANILSGAQT